MAQPTLIELHFDVLQDKTASSQWVVLSVRKKVRKREENREVPANTRIAVPIRKSESPGPTPLPPPPPLLLLHLLIPANLGELKRTSETRTSETRNIAKSPKRTERKAKITRANVRSGTKTTPLSVKMTRMINQQCVL